MPLTPKHNIEDPVKANVKGDKETKFAISNWAAYTNTKALLINAGESHHIYAGRFKPFTPLSINKMLGVYIINGHAPSPQLKWKMQPQTKVSSHGNNFVARCIGPGYQHLCRSFQCFFGYQDPLMTPPHERSVQTSRRTSYFGGCNL